jgi:hypothetical protein
MIEVSLGEAIARQPVMWHNPKYDPDILERITKDPELIDLCNHHINRLQIGSASGKPPQLPDNFVGFPVSADPIVAASEELWSHLISAMSCVCGIQLPTARSLTHRIEEPLIRRRIQWSPVSLHPLGNGPQAGDGHSQVFLAGQENTYFLPGIYQVYYMVLPGTLPGFFPGSESQALLVFNDHQSTSAGF